MCTVKGLRDRRIRLSVPTAIQLYDLQDRLGLSQPSKVVDWLIDATKNEIDKLPPLQMPPPSLSHFFNMKDHQDFVETGFPTNGDHFLQSSNLGMLNTFNNTNTNALISPNSNLSLGPFGNYRSSFSSSQNQCPQHNMSPFPSGSHHQQLYFCPSSSTSATTLPSLVPPYNSSQLNHFHPNSLMPTLQLISTPVKSSFSLNDNNKGLNLQAHHKEGTGS